MKLVVLFILIFSINIGASDDTCCGSKLEGRDELIQKADFSQDNFRIANELKECTNSLNEKQIETIFSQLINLYFPKLKNANIKINYFDDDAYFFAAGQGNVFKNRKKRNYTIRVSRSILNGKKCPPPSNAVRSIIAHELFHIQDYYNKSFFGMIMLGSKYIPFRGRSRNKYERGTDERVLEIGYAKSDVNLVNGIKEYREWIYPMLNAKELKKKKKMYFTPKDVDDWIKEKEGH